MAKKKRAQRRKKAAPASVGLSTAEVRSADDPRLRDLAAQVDADGGAVLGSYSDPFGGTSVLFVALSMFTGCAAPTMQEDKGSTTSEVISVEPSCGGGGEGDFGGEASDAAGGDNASGADE